MPSRPGITDRIRRRGVAAAATALATIGVAGAAVVAGAAPAGAATANHASFTYAWFDKSTHTVHIRGYARHGSSSQSVKVRVYVNGHIAHVSAAYHPSAVYDRRHHVHGGHQYISAFKAPAGAKTVTLAMAGHRVAGATLARYANQGSRIVAIAKPYVGARYSYGASGPHSFDCSGYARYVFAKADVASLPHNAESQRHHVRHISRAAAKPGDLVFYLSGGSAYHVAIYAGHGMQYSAATPRQGVVYAKIWSHNVQFGTDWH